MIRCFRGLGSFSIKTALKFLLLLLLGFSGYRAGKIIWYQGLRSYLTLHHFPKLNGAYSKALRGFEAEAVKSGRIVILGDSIPGRCSWPTGQIANQGIDGDTVYGLSQRLYEVERQQPRWILLSIGANDLLFGSSPDDVFTEYKKLLAAISNFKLKPKVFVQEVLPQNISLIVSALSFNKDVLSLNKKLASLKQSDVQVGSFLDEFELPSEFTLDGEHLNSRGCIEWFEWIRKNLK